MENSPDTPPFAASSEPSSVDPRGTVVEPDPAAAPDASANSEHTAPATAIEERIHKVIDVMRPAVQADNGDLLFRSFDAETGVVEVELVGACVTCPASNQTLKAGVERIMRDRIPEVTEVNNIGEVLPPEELDGGIGETAVSL